MAIEYCQGVELYNGIRRPIPNTEPVTVRVEPDPRSSQIKIDCPYFIAGGICHRLWMDRSIPFDINRGLEQRCIFLDPLTSSSLEAPTGLTELQPKTIDTLAQQVTRQITPALLALVDRRIAETISSITNTTARSTPAIADQTLLQPSGEIPSLETSSKALSMRKGREYYPFSDTQTLPKIDWQEAMARAHKHGRETEVLRRDITFRKIPGVFFVETFFPEDDDILEFDEADKPMGPVTVVLRRTYDNNGDSSDEAMETPVRVGVRFYPADEEEQDVLSGHMLEVGFGESGESKYYLCFLGEDTEDANTFNEYKEGKKALLRYELDTLQKISVKIITKDEYDDL